MFAMIRSALRVMALDTIRCLVISGYVALVEDLAGLDSKEKV